MNYRDNIKEVMILYPDVLVKNADGYKNLIELHKIAQITFGQDYDGDIVKRTFEDASLFQKIDVPNYNFYLFFTNFSRLNKIAYSNSDGMVEEYGEFDLNKWADMVSKIYDAVRSKDMTVSSAIDYYSNTLDKASAEDISFKQWIKYYQNGEHLKYNSKQPGLVKSAWQFPVVSPGNYGLENAAIPDSVYNDIQNLKQEYNNYQESKQQQQQQQQASASQTESSNKQESFEQFYDWKNKVDTAIRRLDRLIRAHNPNIKASDAQKLAEHLFNFDKEMRGLQTNITASDVAYKYANKFKKLGFNNGYNELVKYAQELTGEPPTAPTAPAAPVATTPPPEVTKQAPATTPPAGEAAPVTESAEPKSSLEKALEPITEAKEEEYESLAGDVGLGDAVEKLEEIAGRLSDRRTIRQLAEFDIILDKIGIAPMFPELAEAQSKLIDAYSYALTRVTKMLGMLSSGKSLVEISDAKKNDLINKTNKEVNKVLEAEPMEESGEAAGPAEKSDAEAQTSIQQGIQDSGLTSGAPAAPPTK
jgi:hypothetical protein